jgi:hypothetical protein
VEEGNHEEREGHEELRKTLSSDFASWTLSILATGRTKEEDKGRGQRRRTKEEDKETRNDP